MKIKIDNIIAIESAWIKIKRTCKYSESFQIKSLRNFSIFLYLNIKSE